MACKIIFCVPLEVGAFQYLCPEMQANEIQCCMNKHHKVSFLYYFIFDRIMCVLVTFFEQKK